MLFLRLWKHAGPNDLAEISIPTLAEECGLKVETAMRDLAWLVQEGWVLRVDVPRGHTSRYKIRCLRGKQAPRQQVLDREGVHISTAPIVPPSASSTPSLPSSPAPAAISDPRPASAPPRRKRTTGEIPLPPDAPDLADDEQVLLSRWWQQRCRAHPRADRLALGRLTLAAIEHAKDAGVLSDYLEKAREAGWLSLGHQGCRRVIQDLKNAASQHTDHVDFSGAMAHTGSRMLESDKPKPGHSGRRQQFLDDALRLITIRNDGHDQDTS
jgi:hypothetical protein